jgi:integrase
MVARLQTDRLAAGAGPSAVRKAVVVLGSILQRAAESGRIASNPVRVVRKATPLQRPEVIALAPATIEAMRAASTPRDAALLSVLAYAGLWPAEAPALRWGAVRDRTLLVERSVSLGDVKATETGRTRTVRLLSPLARDLAEWKLRSGRPSDHKLLFPGHDGQPWSEPAYQSWRRRAFGRAARTPGLDPAPRPYDLRHSFASLLIHEGASVVEVSRQLGHSATMCLGTYAHVLDELVNAPRLGAEAAILAARATSVGRELPIGAGNGP